MVDFATQGNKCDLNSIFINEVYDLIIKYKNALNVNRIHNKNLKRNIQNLGSKNEKREFGIKRIAIWGVQVLSDAQIVFLKSSSPGEKLRVFVGEKEER